jgi:hypothetical protein
MVVAHVLIRLVLLGPQDIVRHEDMSRISSTDRFVKRLSTIDFGGQLIFLFGMVSSNEEAILRNKTRHYDRILRH